MSKRFMSIWFRYLKTDWYTRRNPDLGKVPFVLASPDHGRMIITSANFLAEGAGLHCGMPVADARAIIADLEVQDDDQNIEKK
jgi:protein ImuB